MSCLNICEYQFSNIYLKIDHLKEVTLLKHNNLTHWIDLYSLELLKNVKLKMIQLSHHNARLDAISKILFSLLSPLEESTRVTYSGINLYEFIFCILLAFSFGYFIETFRTFAIKYQILFI